MSSQKTCKKIDDSCNEMNVLLEPCFFKIDFTRPTFGDKWGLDTWQIPKCMCSQDFYNNLVSCGKSCDQAIDEPSKFESDCRIGNHPIQLEKGGKTNETPQKNDTNANQIPTSNNSTSNSNSNSSPLSLVATIGTVVGGLTGIVGLITALIKLRKKLKERNNNNNNVI
ncbi:17097_t:CDS:2 [Funneliformis geosporum]|uniref:17097_t:CDS:1 n=1 Tax=Funneliformis geosporum TaxID=1117311 RepID=A0A9W4WHT7_9GLOM|nr:17097_t:CDS:2 [Funneliformis geosporum]